MLSGTSIVCKGICNDIFPVLQDQISDWFDSLAECLHWNVRKKQKTLDDSGQVDPYADVPQDS